MVNGKWYIGKTSDVFTRYAQYKEGNVSAWTRIHKPIKVHFSYEQKSPFDEDKTTKEYMAKYGIENVRGGAFVRPTLPERVLQDLQKEIWMAMDCCFRCGSPDHFGKSCPISRSKIILSPTPTPPPSPEIQSPNNSPIQKVRICSNKKHSHIKKDTPDPKNKIRIECIWCNQLGHSVLDCPCKCAHCGYVGHTSQNCWKRCYLCNTLGHIASKCVLLPLET